MAIAKKPDIVLKMELASLREEDKLSTDLIFCRKTKMIDKRSSNVYTFYYSMFKFLLVTKQGGEKAKK
ncbi:MAG: hypothetical protein QME49_01250 [bacterium]|nr:hypothetical protein [bacterium]